MELYILRYVVAVADYESFSLAAKACYVGQPTLSQQISRLESSLGLKLFQRNTRNVKLTEAGTLFVHRAREIIQRADALQAEMSDFAGVRKGTLNMGIITSLQCIQFGELLSTFCRKYPSISVNIQQDGTHTLIHLLLERNLDAAIINRPERLPSQLHFLKLGEDQYSLAVPSHHPLAQRSSVKLSELANERFIFHQQGQIASELCLNACRQAGFDPVIVCRSGSPTTGLFMVRGGMGVAFLPSEEFRHRSIDGIKEIFIEEKIVKEVGIAWRGDTMSPLIDAIVAFSSSWAETHHFSQTSFASDNKT